MALDIEKSSGEASTAERGDAAAVERERVDPERVFARDEQDLKYEVSRDVGRVVGEGGTPDEVGRAEQAAGKAAAGAAEARGEGEAALKGEEEDEREDGSPLPAEVAEAARGMSEGRDPSAADLKAAEAARAEVPESKWWRLDRGLLAIGFGVQEVKSLCIAAAAESVSKALRREIPEKLEGGAKAAAQEKEGQRYVIRLLKEYSESSRATQKRASENRESIWRHGKLASKIEGVSAAAQTALWGRLLLDYGGASSLRVLNPFRTVTAAAMFAGRFGEMNKEARLKSHEAIEKTRVEDEERAAEEAWAIYNAAAANSDGAVTAEVLSREYKRQLPRDIVNRLDRGEGELSGFFGKIAAPLMRRKAERAAAALDHYGDAGPLTSIMSPEDRRAEQDKILKKYEKFLKDAERIAGDVGTIDAIGYWSRVAEKTAKGVGMALAIDTAATAVINLVKHAPDLFEAVQERFGGAFAGDSVSRVATASIIGNGIGAGEAPDADADIQNEPAGPAEAPPRQIFAEEHVAAPETVPVSEPPVPAVEAAPESEMGPAEPETPVEAPTEPPEPFEEDRPGPFAAAAEEARPPVDELVPNEESVAEPVMEAHGAPVETEAEGLEGGVGSEEPESETTELETDGAPEALPESEPVPVAEPESGSTEFESEIDSEVQPDEPEAPEAEPEHFEEAPGEMAAENYPDDPVARMEFLREAASDMDNTTLEAHPAFSAAARTWAEAGLEQVAAGEDIDPAELQMGAGEAMTESSPRMQAYLEYLQRESGLEPESRLGYVETTEDYIQRANSDLLMDELRGVHHPGIQSIEFPEGSETVPVPEVTPAAEEIAYDDAPPETMTEEATLETPAETAEVGVQESLAEAREVYNGDIDHSLGEARRSVEMFSKIVASPEFEDLSPSEQAEALHHEGYSRLAAENLRLEARGGEMTAADVDHLRSEYARAGRLIERSLEAGSGDPNMRERSLNALVKASRDMAGYAIRIRVDHPELEAIAVQAETESVEWIRKAVEETGGTRYAGDGMYVFPPEGRRDVVNGVIGLLRFTGDMPPDITAEEAFRDGVQGVHYEVADQVAPWANAVLRGELPAGPAEKALIDSMVQEGILVRTESGEFGAGSVEDLIFTQPDVTIFTHEVAHGLQDEFMDQAEEAYRSLSPEDRKLFDDYMLTYNKDLPRESKIAEFFAYSQQATDWKAHARNALEVLARRNAR